MPFHDLVDCIYTLYKHWPASQARRPVATVLISVQLDQPMIQNNANYTVEKSFLNTCSSLSKNPRGNKALLLV
ncbi:Inner centromere protein [Trichinella spiralis]|uniref:Inner centromere protein n=1 Tax=Trichinella spiralis TaxID=6334 RepID=A0ABR3KTF5_TRISP